MTDRDIDLCINGTEQAAPVYPPAEPEIHTLGYKKYEITNYLGNVNAVITDRKVFVGGTYEAVVIMNSDYYPFGMEMPGRHNNENKYRFGYNGMELDNEAKGNGNSYTTEFRQYDPRLGRWLSLDPLMAKYPGMSPYVAFNNNPIFFNDPLGLEGDPPTKNWVEGDKCVDENNNQLTYVGNDEWLEDVNYDYAQEVVITADSPVVKGTGTGWTRFWGVVQAVGGAIEAGVGAALIATGVGAPLGAILVVHGADQVAAGVTQAATGEHTETLTHRGVRKIAETAGASKQTADNVATGVDIAYSVGGGVGAVKTTTTVVKPAIKVATAEEVAIQTENTITTNLLEKIPLAEESIGHSKVWSVMTETERKAFQHSYSRHFEEFGLPVWRQSNAGSLQIEFNNAIARIRKAGMDSFFKSTEWVNGVRTIVNRAEPIINGQRYFYYETLNGKFVSAGKMPL